MGRLRAVLANFPVRDVVIHVLVLHRRRVPIKVRVFVDHLAAQFGNLPFRDRGLARYLRAPTLAKTRIQACK